MCPTFPGLYKPETILCSFLKHLITQYTSLLLLLKIMHEEIDVAVFAFFLFGICLGAMAMSAVVSSHTPQAPRAPPTPEALQQAMQVFKENHSALDKFRRDLEAMRPLITQHGKVRGTYRDLLINIDFNRDLFGKIKLAVALSDPNAFNSMGSS